MPRHIVCLTYDFDALSLPVAKGHVTPTPLSRGAFGVVGVERIRRLIRRARGRGAQFATMADLAAEAAGRLGAPDA
ncbi:MAG: hypothetical protein P1U88_15685 [Thalassobaculaceae bacterium]|nr:hypothetical protein [Thalassobaculaceae bacterium]